MTKWQAISILIISSFVEMSIDSASAQTPRNKYPSLLNIRQIQLVGLYKLHVSGGPANWLELQSDGRFSFAGGSDDEINTIYDSGTWSYADDVIRLKSSQPASADIYSCYGDRFVPVQWGASIYLEDENLMPAYAVSLAKLQKPPAPAEFGLRGLGQFVRIDKSTYGTAVGPPSIPSRFHRYYTSGMITARVVSVEPDGSLRINKGSFDGLRDRQVLAVSPWAGIDVRISRCDVTYSIARPVYFLDSVRTIQVGDTCVTGDFAIQPHETGFESTPKPPRAGSAPPKDSADMFKDLETDHWAYAVTESLRMSNVVWGYPVGYFRGHRILTRYEFAVAIDRALKVMPFGAIGGQGDDHWLTMRTLPPPIRVRLSRLVTEFWGELAALGWGKKQP